MRGWGDRLGNMLVECMVLIARRPGGTIGISIYDPRLTSSPPTTDTSTESDLRAILTDLGYKETEITEILGTLRKGEENMRLLWAYLERFGRPLAFYTDKAGMF